jgi:phosphohistidine swiveling domain-containing protein
MNIEFTDKAFASQKDNPIIKKNLSGVAEFKELIRSYMDKVLFESDGYTNELFTILGKQFEIQPSIFHDLTQEEIIDLYDNKRPNIDKTSKRQKMFVINYDGQIYEKEKALTIIKTFRKNTVGSLKVSGSVASLGKAVGPVKIISVNYTDLGQLHEEIAKMHKGDILVTETTSPELIVACKKAAAIVTDIGGLLSHAAIVSREFGIPCIVGTENATRVFKDSDIVEVNTEKGTVTRIS